MKYQVAWHSIRGTRASNQDRVACIERRNAVLMVLADGLGGHAGGALAAEILVQVATKAFQAVRQKAITEPSAFLALIMMKAHRAMHAVGTRNRPPIQPRTTGVLCLVQDGYAYWAHIGDSRLYHFRNGSLLTRTRDDSSAEELRKGGVLSEDEMLTHPGKSVLLKCLGSSEPPKINFGEEIALQRSDVLLLCSDGLWEIFAPGEMLRYLEQGPLEERLTQMLFDAEDRKSKGSDNISAVSLRWEDGVTSMPRLQRHGVNIDQKALLAAAAMPSRAKQAGAGTEAHKPEPSLEESLRELDKLLKQFTTKN